jgi:hypothetical protein
MSNPLDPRPPKGESRMKPAADTASVLRENPDSLREIAAQREVGGEKIEKRRGRTYPPG